MDRFKGDVTQVRGKVSDMAASVENELPTESGMTYLQVKNHALLTYTKMELFFALLKLEEPETVKDHPVFKELVRYRTLLERIRPLDRKMKYQVDKMLKVALSGGKGLDESLSYAPNPDQLAAEDEQDEDEEGEEGSSGAKDGIYRAPRLAAVPYEEEERAQVKQAKKDERNRKRLQKSTILAELREEFSERPAEILASGTSVVDKEIAREEAEKKDFEESRFVRVVTSRKDKIRKRQREMEASRADNVGSIDNFAAVQDILSLDKSKHRIPTPREPKKIGGKTGGIFSHVDAPSYVFQTEKKRKVARSGGGGSGAVATSSTASGSTTSAPKKSSGKKKKVVFSNLFS
uniref:Neuroguidin n=1 Tax=Phytophthora ramorum TaxID=164328 RepID=H3GPN6_PHYRM